MKAWLRGMILLFSLAVNPAFAYQCGFDQAMTQMLSEFIEENNIPGAAISIKLPDHSICNYAVGYADVISKKPMTNATLFSVANINKSFTSVALLQLEQSGKLKLSNTLASVAQNKSPLGQLIKKYPRLGAVKIQELLNHTSGVPEAYSYEEDFVKNPEAHTDSFTLLKSALQEKWGTQGEVHYTNSDYILAGMVIEDVTQKPLSFTIQNLLAQANITDAYLPDQDKAPVSDTISNLLAQGYMPNNAHSPALFNQALKHSQLVTVEGAHESQQAYEVTKVNLAQLSVGTAASGMLMSTPDMIKWYEYLFLSKSNIGPSVQQKLFSPFGAENSINSFDIAMSYLPDYDFTVYTHSGNYFGYNTNLIYIKNNNIIIALAINSQRDKLRLNQELASSILDYLKGAGYFAEYAHQKPGEANITI